MTSHLLREFDPAAGLHPEADLALLAYIVAQPRRRAISRPKRRLTAGVVLTAMAGTAAAVAAIVLAPRQGDSGIGDAAFRVTRSADGTVSAQIRWDRIDDPAALQAALDRVGARTRVFVLAAGSRICSSDQTTGYSANAVDWHIPRSSGATDGLVVHPRYFPARGTFVVVVERSAPGTLSTAGPGTPAINGYNASMVIGRVSDPRC